jgi:hypothetical protein
MGRTCGTYGGEERCIQGFSVGKLEERRPLGNPDVEEMIILKWIFERLDGGRRLDRSGTG